MTEKIRWRRESPGPNPDQPKVRAVADIGLGDEVHEIVSPWTWSAGLATELLVDLLINWILDSRQVSAVLADDQRGTALLETRRELENAREQLALAESRVADYVMELDQVRDKWSSVQIEHRFYKRLAELLMERFKPTP